jgi:hypothetical protein
LDGGGHDKFEGYLQHVPGDTEKSPKTGSNFARYFQNAMLQY